MFLKTVFINPPEEDYNVNAALKKKCFKNIIYNKLQGITIFLIEYVRL